MTTAVQQVRERPILFSSPMVKAILDGRKTQTRRVVNMPQWIKDMGGNFSTAFPDKAFGVTPCLQVPCTHDGHGFSDPSVQRLRNPWGWPEPSHLWVRETLKADERGMFYAADETLVEQSRIPDDYPIVKETLPSMFMPRWASRINLEITGVRVERLQSITGDDCIAEGILHGCTLTDAELIKEYASLWDKINGKRFPWSSNPWVFVIEFRRLDHAS